MTYLVTGGTGFIGRFLVERLLRRKGSRVLLVVREGSEAKVEALRERLDADAERLVAVRGDITEEGVLSKKRREKLRGKVDHVFHLAAVYDMAMDDETADRVNNEGTRNVIRLANELGGDVRLHHVSSVAIAGADFVGTFRESMFDEGQDVSHPYYRTKFQSERIVREEAAVPFRVYRPGMVVGASDTGEMDKIDGPYYFFPILKAIRDRVPKWLPLLGVDGGRMPIAPVDYVADAIDEIAHRDGQDGQTFCLVQRPAPSVGEILRTFLRVAHGPDMAARLDLRAVPGLGPARRLARSIPIPASVQAQASEAIGVPVPVSVFGYLFNRADFDDTNTRRALEGSDIRCPKLETYADKLWSYWEMHLHHDVRVPPRLLRKIQSRVVMITGASSGIGLALAKKLGAAGAIVVLVARSRDKLEETKKIVERLGGTAHVYPCDLTNLEEIDACADQVLADLGQVDVLVNNAGRSIRRSIWESLDRFHDFERTMQLNYFGAVRLILRLLPSMRARKQGHVINVSSIGCLANVPRFSAYVASKSALDAFSRVISAEVRSWNISMTTVYMPLVRTPMIAPTKIYDYFPTMTPEQAADLVVKAIVDKPKRISSRLGVTAEVSYAVWPTLNDRILEFGFHLFPSSVAARGKSKDDPKAPAEEDVRPSREGIAFANLFRGLHW